MLPRNAKAVTSSPEALRSFLVGMDSFRTYLTTSLGPDLQAASAAFEEAVLHDPQFHLASFYHAVALTELRDSDAAIRTFESLLEAGASFQAEVHYHLAYAYVKKYREEAYDRAAQALDSAEAAAKQENNRDVAALVRVARLFYAAVTGGRDRRLSEQDRKDRLERTIRDGKELLDAPPKSVRAETRAAIEVEANNAIGIAYMRLGQRPEAFGHRRQQLWREAELHYRAALAVQPRNVRVLANLGTLRIYQDLHDDAKQFFKQVITINPFDQFPHYRLAWLSAETRDWGAARDHFQSILKHKGAIRPEDLEALRQAIEARDRTKLPRPS